MKPIILTILFFLLVGSGAAAQFSPPCPASPVIPCVQIIETSVAGYVPIGTTVRLQRGAGDGLWAFIVRNGLPDRTVSGRVRAYRLTWTSRVDFDFRYIIDFEPQDDTTAQPQSALKDGEFEVVR